MKITVNTVIADLENYISLFNISLSDEARKTLRDIEEFAFRCNNPNRYDLFFSKLILNMNDFQEFLTHKGINFKLTALLLEKHYYSSLDELASYSDDNTLYSSLQYRNVCDNLIILDKALEFCTIDNRGSIQNKDILLAAMNTFEAIMKDDGSNWTDKKLNTDYTTLSHITGRHIKELWVTFDDIREHFSSEIMREKAIVA
jgi:hypothetical protein